MLIDAARQPRQTDHARAMREAGDTCDGVFEFDRIALALAHHDGGDFQMACASTSSAVRVWLMVPR